MRARRQRKGTHTRAAATKARKRLATRLELLSLPNSEGRKEGARLSLSIYLGIVQASKGRQTNPSSFLLLLLLRPPHPHLHSLLTWYSTSVPQVRCHRVLFVPRDMTRKRKQQCSKGQEWLYLDWKEEKDEHMVRKACGMAPAAKQFHVGKKEEQEPSALFSLMWSCTNGTAEANSWRKENNSNSSERGSRELSKSMKIRKGPPPPRRDLSCLRASGVQQEDSNCVRSRPSTTTIRRRRTCQCLLGQHTAAPLR